MNGRFITFEGGEGAGKSTQVRVLAEYLRAAGRNIVLTREPGGSAGAELIRKLLVEGEPDRWSPMAETLMFMAARADHLARLIDPAIAAGQWVICDRFSDSTAVYQGAGRDLGIDLIRSLQRLAGARMPDLTFVLDIDPVAGLQRTRDRGIAEDRFERFDVAFHQRLRSAFLELAQSEPARCSVIDASRPAEIIAEEIRHIVAARLT